MTDFSNKRLLFLPPGVQKGKEKMPKCDDFICFETKPLGQGAFGEVFKVRHKISKKDYAIKVIKKRKIIERRMLPQLRREVRIMYSLRHPNIISLYSHFEDNENFYLILEYAPGGQLFSRLRKFKTMPEAVAAQYMREICLAVQYLHSRLPPIIHRDIKPENILISADDSIKLGDFGWSNFLDDERDTYCGTLEYLAPEMVERKGHGVSLDIWSLGVLLFELLAGVSPFKGRTQLELFQKIKSGKIAFPKAFPILAKNLVKKLIVVEPDRRLPAELILDHAWIVSHAPLRPTVELVKEKVMLPSVPDEGDVDFAESGYDVVSSPGVKNAQINVNLKIHSDKTNRENEKIGKLNQEISKYQEKLKNLSDRVEKGRETGENLTKSILELKKTLEDLTKADDAIESLKRRTSELKHRSNLVYKRYISKVVEVKLFQKRKKETEKDLFRSRTKLKTQEMKLSISKQCKHHLLKLNCFHLLKHKLQDLFYAVSIMKKSLSNPKYLPLAKQQLSIFNPDEDLKSEIEKFIPEFKKVFSQRSRSMKVITRKLKDLKSASSLQSQIFQTIRPRLVS
jgi:serine/threonine protein kinase